ncbi:MAG: hypothetical protein ACON4P_01760 [Candidatus Puniceispirillales bacterium]
MDYFQTTERYRKRELRNQLGLLFFLVILGLAVWIGWFWGYSQSEAVVSSNAERAILLDQENDRLEQKIATLVNQLNEEQARRKEAELLSGKASDPGKRNLDRTIARYLSNGVEVDQIRLALKSLARPLRCRAVEQRDIAVATGYFAGKEATAEMLDGSVQVFIEGEVGRDSSRDRPWFDPDKPISIRIAYLGGEKVATGALPVETTLIADTWLIKVSAQPTALQGYVELSMEKCSLG